MIDSPSRRLAFGRIGGGLLAALASSSVLSSPAPAETAESAGALARLTQGLRQIPRRRGFKSVPFLLTDPQDWDEQASRLLLAYGYHTKQAWENTEITAGWPVLMREAMNGEVFSHRNPEFLEVSATHGLAHLALFNDDAWSRYGLSQLAGPQFATNTLIREKPAVARSDDPQDVDGFYGPLNNNIVSLQKRGAVFVACHDSIYAIARRLQSAAAPQSQLARMSTGIVAADLTNSLIPDCVLVPSVVAFLVELQKAGFTYVKGS